MIEDFELEQRYLKTVQNTKNKWQKENKKYLERVEQMKEKKEENYLNRRNMLIKQIDKKQQDIENKLYRIRESKEGQRKKHLKLMQKKRKFSSNPQKKKRTTRRK